MNEYERKILEVAKDKVDNCLQVMNRLIVTLWDCKGIETDTFLKFNAGLNIMESQLNIANLYMGDLLPTQFQKEKEEEK